SQKFVNHLPAHTTVVSVNSTISRHFETAEKFPVTDVYYGILNDQHYFPPQQPRDSETIRFCMLGDLDSDWKGSDVGIEAFLALPEEIAQHAELHLAAFANNPPDVDDPRIHVHQWIDRDKVGDFLRDMDIMLALSRDLGRMMETFCQTMVQGMLCSLPVITTPLEILTEKLDEGGGRVTDGPDSLVKAMVEFSQNIELRQEQGAIAHHVAKERYVWNSEYFMEKYG
ncbi:MAG: glycosyltransferase family 4 protein, partial [Verrucomicrobiota bacterium]